MKRYFSLLLASLLTVTLNACFKTELKIVVKNDATGMIASKAGYSQDTIERLAENLELFPEGFEAQLEMIESEFIEKKMVSAAKESGVEVTSSKEYQKDGWKYVDIQGKIKDVNAWVAASEKASKAKRAKMVEVGAANSPVGFLAEAFFGINFYKTDKEGVGEVELVPPIEDIDTSRIGLPGGVDEKELSERRRKMVEALLDRWTKISGLKDHSKKITVVLPGKVLKTIGCTKDALDEKQVSFTFAVASIGFDDLKGYFGMKKGIRATFEIPKDCKIKFQVKKATPKMNAPAEKPKRGDDKKKSKKGGARIGEDDGGK